MLGRTEPRLWTPPLRELTPDTSFGFEVIEHGRDVCGEPFDPWEEWLLIHGGELLPSGLPRFRIVLVLVARQNGKTHTVKLLTSYWLHVDLPGSRYRPTVLGTSSKLDYAKESWSALVDMTYAVPELAAECGPRRQAVREANGEQEIKTLFDTRYKIAAANADAGRSLTICRLVLDELRQHHDWTAWNAAEPTTSAVEDAQIWCLSNAGTDRSVVLNSLRDQAVEAIENGTSAETDVLLAEWSAPEDADPEDVTALAQANPNLGRRKALAPLLAAGRRAKAAGGEELTGFKTEHMCIRVKIHKPAINPVRWKACLDPGDLAAVRDRVAVCAEVSEDGLHATLAAAAVLDDGRVRVEIVAAWSGPGCTRELRNKAGGWLLQIQPVTFGWFPAGPAAAVAAKLADRKKSGRDDWPPPGVTVEEIRQETTAVCMGFAELVDAGQVAHSGDPLLDAHVEAAEKLQQGDAWRFARRGAGHVDATYAAAGAAHLARTLPPPVRPRIRTMG